MTEFKTSIQIVVYNGASWLPWCLESLARQTHQDFFLLIIDNGSIDKSVDIIQEFLAANPELAARTRLVRNKQNVGFARGHNQALVWTKSEFVLVLNQDVYLMPSYLAELITSLDNLERAGAVSGKILHWPFEAETFHVSDFSNLKNQYIDSLGLGIKRNRRVVNLGQGEQDLGQYSKPQQLFGVAGTAPLYRRQALAEVSPLGEFFDEDFVSYKEDVDLAWRLRLAGWQAWLAPQAVAYHDRSLSQSQGLKQEYQKRKVRARDLKVYSWVNHLGILIKNDGFINFWQDFPWIAGHELGKAGFLLLTDPLTLFRGKFRLLKLLPRFFKKRRQLKTTHKISYKELRSWWAGVRVRETKI